MSQVVKEFIDYFNHKSKFYIAKGSCVFDLDHFQKGILNKEPFQSELIMKCKRMRRISHFHHYGVKEHLPHGCELFHNETGARVGNLLQVFYKKEESD